ncbi:MAG TPA: hypothetical protein VE981_14030 [Planctomycetota bacterium]|nr:hypothetical protein [Planctomycetota bacterium]
MIALLLDLICCPSLQSDPSKVSELIGKRSSDKVEERDAASRSLSEIGESARPR